MPPNYKNRGKPRETIRLQQVADNDLGLPKLTEKQEKFVQGLLEGLNYRDAYRQAYDCSNMADKSITTDAWRLRAKPKIAQSIRFYQRQAMADKVSREGHLAELARLRELAVDNTQISAGVQAEHYRGKVAGFYEDKLRVAVGPTDEAILAQVRELLGEDIAQAVGEGLGQEPKLLEYKEE